MSKAGAFWLALLFVFAGFVALRFVQARHGENQDAAQLLKTEQDDTHVDVVQTAEESTDDDVDRLTEFTLTDQFGKPFRSSDLKGKVWIGSFFFTSCPSTCREQNLRVAELQRDFAARGLQILSITCEPARDTPTVLANYADKFGADFAHWHFLTGDDLKYIRRVGADIFQIVVQEQTHSDRIVIFDEQGVRRAALRTRDPEDFIEAQKLLDELLPKLEAANS